MYDNLSDKSLSIIVTGGCSGIGRNISENLISEGYRVIAISRKSSSYDFTHDSLKKIDCDLTDFTETKNCFQNLSNSSENIVGLVNNVGLSEWKSLFNMDKHFIETLIKTNLYTTIFTTKFAVEYIKSISSIVNISSLAGKRGTKNNAIYVASKFALEGFTRSMCVELGEVGIRVNSICPVLIKTPGLVNQIEVGDGPAKLKGLKKFLSDFARDQTSLKRLPDASEVSDLVAFLLSKKSNAITGQSINIDCGVLPG